jgi:Flp pilus assembly pilin Flp
MARGKPFLSRLIRRNSGAAAVEFALVLSVLVMLVMGMVDLGHAFYLKQIITNASREGARYGVVYISNGGVRIPPDNLNPSIQDWVLKGPSDGGQCDLSNILAGDDPKVDPTLGTGYTSGAVGDDLIVKVTCVKTWWILNKFIPTLGDTITLTATTTMRVE